MASRRIQITQDILDQSVRANSSHCMIADAIKHQIPSARAVSVDLQTMRYSLSDERFVYFTPRKAQLALIKFDQGDTDIEPFDFSLGSPTQVIKRRRSVPPATPAEAKIRAAQSRGGKKSQQKAKLARLAAAKKGTTKIGGKLPPTFTVQSNLGNRRIFGLRAARA